MSKLLIESTRTELISQAKAGESRRSGDTRWAGKADCSLISSALDYNQINMDKLFKKDQLDISLKVQGKTNIYNITIVFSGVFKEIQAQVQANHNKLETSCVYQALLKLSNSKDLKVSCNCADFKYRLAFFASKNGIKAGDEETRPSEVTNPNDSKGALCKHLSFILDNLSWLSKVATVITNYIKFSHTKMKYNYETFMFPKVYGMSHKEASNLIKKSTNKNKVDYLNLSQAL